MMNTNDAMLCACATSGGGAALPTPTIWYDASDTGTITNVSGKASAIADKGSSGDDLVQATDANRPLTGSTTRNGLNTLDYSAGSKSLYNLTPTTSQVTVQFLVGYLASSVTYATSGKCLVSYELANAGRESVFLGSITSAYTDEVISHFSFDPTSMKLAWGDNTATIAAGVHIVAVRSTNIACEIRLNGGADLLNRSNVSTRNHNTVHEILLNCGSTTGAFSGWSEFCEQRAYANDLTDDEINAVGSAIASKWGITWTNIS